VSNPTGTRLGSPVRILHFLPWLHSGGVERRRLELARGLDKRRYLQRVVCLHGLDHLIADFVGAGVEVTPLGGNLLSRRNVLAAVRAAFEWRPDIIHGAVFEGVILAALAGLANPRSKIILEEIDFPLHRSPRARLLFRALALRSDRCVAVSPAVLEFLKTEGIPDRKRRLIMNAAPRPRLPPESEWGSLRAHLGIPSNAFVVGTVGRLNDRHKRVSDLIQALSILRPSNPDLHLLIVGDGPDRVVLERLVQELDLCGAVSFAGYQSDTGPMYAVMDLFALASERESFGLVLVEAMFAGLAVVGTRTSGVANVVEDGNTGVLVSVGAPSEFARAVADLKSDAGRRRAMGEAGRARAERLFSSARYVADVARLYEEVLGERDATRDDPPTSTRG